MWLLLHLPGVVQKVTFLGNTDNVNFGWFAYDSTDGHPKKCYPILNHANMTLNSQDLKKIADLTLEHYNQRATAFWEGTRHHNVTPNIAILLQYIEAQAPFTILDFGCGPGRDLKVFCELGHIAVGLDGTARFVDMARAHSSCEVWQQDFCKLDLPDKHFDGIFANASLFHVPSQELPRVLLELYATLKTGGVLFSSNPHGHNEEGWSGGRYGAYYDLQTWQRHMSDAGFVELTHYYRPDGLARHQQPWLASVWRKLPADIVNIQML